ncbi:hypothetical protein Tco_1257824 [Tanacetum coccineum]
MGLHSLVCSGEILDGANGCGLNKSNVRRSLANEHGIRVLKIDKKNGSDPHLVATVREREEDMRICYATYINAFEVRHGNNWTFATLGNVYFDTLHPKGNMIFDKWKWSKRKKPCYTICKFEDKWWKFDIWK